MNGEQRRSYRRALHRSDAAFRDRRQGYLLDSENRRFWPVSTDIGGNRGNYSKLEALKLDVDQLWAEARNAYRRGESWDLTASEKALAAAAAEERRVRDDLEEVIPPLVEDKGYVPALELKKQLASHLYGSSEVVAGRRIAKVMHRLGFEQRRSNSIAWWVRPDAEQSWRERKAARPAANLGVN